MEPVRRRYPRDEPGPGIGEAEYICCRFGTFIVLAQVLDAHTKSLATRLASGMSSTPIGNNHADR